MTEPRPGMDPATSAADLSDRQWALMGGMEFGEVAAYARNLAREVNRLRADLADANDETEQIHQIRLRLIDENKRLRADLADAQRDTAERIAAEIDKRSYVVRSDPLHSDQFVAGMTYARNIARGIALGEGALSTGGIDQTGGDER